jgi:hypothetical protein
MLELLGSLKTQAKMIFQDSSNTSTIQAFFQSVFKRQRCTEIIQNSHSNSLKIDWIINILFGRLKYVE